MALTRARDLLLLPRQAERIANDWLSLVDLDINKLPVLDLAGLRETSTRTAASVGNSQDIASWEREAALIAASERKLVWHQPSRHEGLDSPVALPEQVFAGMEAFEERPPAIESDTVIQGGRERGLILHKLMEEVLTRETAEDVAALKVRASTLLAQLGLDDLEDASIGPSSGELASTVHRTLQLSEIIELRPRLQPEFWVYQGNESGKTMTLTAGIADAVAIDDKGHIEVVVDWKSDVDPAPAQIEHYRAQVRDYLAATGASLGLIVFMTLVRIERVKL